MNKYIKNKIKKFVASGRTGRAIDLLLQYRSSDNDISNEIISLSARYRNYLREKHGSLQDNQILVIELNKINNSILYIIEDETELSMIFFNIYTNSTIGAALVVIAVIFGFPQFNGKNDEINTEPQSEQIDTLEFQAATPLLIVHIYYRKTRK
ncbi:MAG: hypothetical protein IPJ40_04345 [Saprospirales bacterium]|nr:hypothetical protein [Saprospirales bacterium]